MKYGKDRRDAKRVGYLCEVECEGDGVRLASRINDLSVTGAFIDSMTSYAPGTILRLRFRIKNIPIEAECEVRYGMQQMGMGVRFLNLKPEYQTVIEHLVDGKPLAEPPLDAPPPAASQARPKPSQDRNMLLGNFAVVSLFDVIQIIENNRLTGALVITSPGANGETYFNAGQIVGAKSGAVAGQEALIKFLDVTEGVFEFHKSESEYECTIQATSNMGLMIDLLRGKDEEAAFS
ncbi:MAG TPA: DUF4388 domain-containing protein [Blastocatellia bacterium]|jgi:hypothetical protein